MKTAAIICIGLLVTWALMFLGQLWYEFMDPEMFAKVTITMGVVAFVTLAVALIRREYVTDQQLKKDKFID